MAHPSFWIHEELLRMWDLHVLTVLSTHTPAELCRLR